MITLTFQFDNINSAREFLDELSARPINAAPAAAPAERAQPVVPVAVSVAPAPVAAPEVALVPVREEGQKPNTAPAASAPVATPDGEKRGRGRPRKVVIGQPIPALLVVAPAAPAAPLPPPVAPPAAPAAPAPLQAAPAAAPDPLLAPGRRPLADLLSPAAPAATPAADPGLAPCQAAMEDLLGSRGAGTCLGLVQAYGVTRTKDLPAEKRAAFLAEAIALRHNFELQPVGPK